MRSDRSGSDAGVAVRAARTVVLNVHGLGEPPRHMSPREAKVWIAPSTFDRILDAVAGREDVMLTFDDGNVSDVEIALPRLVARGMTATFFPVVGTLDQPGFLRGPDVSALVDAGMRIGCHGMRHRPWPDLEPDELYEELVLARQQLEGIAELPVTEAACPFGRYDRSVLAALRRAGYQRVFTSDGGSASSSAWLVPRNSLIRGQDHASVERLLSGERWSVALPRRARRLVKRWR
jgi:peptidoglycan/xylan/chitin deacetylase (PgdA/CDA1 family)